jgi:hypothetical protein
MYLATFWTIFSLTILVTLIAEHAKNNIATWISAGYALKTNFLALLTEINIFDLLTT